MAAQPPEWLDTARPDGLPARWLVSGRDDNRAGVYIGCQLGDPNEYASEGVPYRVSGFGRRWNIVTDYGRFVRTARRCDGRKPSPRQFKTALAAAQAAELLETGL